MRAPVFVGEIGVVFAFFLFFFENNSKKAVSCSHASNIRAAIPRPDVTWTIRDDPDAGSAESPFHFSKIREDGWMEVSGVALRINGEGDPDMLTGRQKQFLSRWCRYSDTQIEATGDLEARRVIADTIAGWERNKEVITARAEAKAMRRKRW